MLACFSLIFSSLPRPAFAGESLTLADCRDTARADHPLVAAARAQAAAAAARQAIGFAGYLPTLTGEAAYQVADGSLSGARGAGDTGLAETYSATLAARQMLWDFGRTRNTEQAAGASVDAAAAELRAARALRDTEAEAAFRTTLAAAELVTAAEEALERALAQAKRAQARVEVGQRPRFDLIRAEVEQAQAELALVAAKNARALARAQLASACGRAALPPEVTLAPPPPRASVEEVATPAIYADAEAGRPELLAARARLRAATEAREAAESQYYPSVSAQGAWGLRGPAPSELVSGWTATALLAVPILAGGADRARVHETEALQALAGANLEQLVRSTRLEVDAGLLAVGEAHSRLEVSVRLERSAEEGMRLAEARYDTGAGDPVEMADAQATLAQARAQRVRAALDVDLAAVRLERILGRDTGRVTSGTKDGE